MDEISTGFMGGYLAKQLVDSLLQQLYVCKFKSGVHANMFRSVVQNAGVPNTFATKLTSNGYQTTVEQDMYHDISLRYLLVNKLNSTGKLPFQNIRDLWHNNVNYSSMTLVGRIARDDSIKKMMEETEHPFSLLCISTTYKVKSNEDGLFGVRKKPILVIPGANLDNLIEWNEENSTFCKESGIFPFSRTQITPAEFYSS